MAWAPMPIRKMLPRLMLMLAAVAAVFYLIPFLFSFLFHQNLAAWHCPPRQVASLTEIDGLGRVLPEWQTGGSIYYRYRPGFGDGQLIVIAGITSADAIAKLRAVGHDPLGWNERSTTMITIAVDALSGVPGFAFKYSDANLSVCWRADVHVMASFDAGSGWFVAAVESSQYPREIGSR